MIGKSSMSNFDQNYTYGAAPDDVQKALVLHFFFIIKIIRDCYWNHTNKLRINFIILNDNLPILINLFGAQTSTNASLSSFITQWYTYGLLPVQLWLRECSSQFFTFALFIISLRESGQESTISAVLFDNKQDVLSLI